MRGEMSEAAFEDKPTRWCKAFVDWVVGPDRWRVTVWDKRTERTYELSIFEAKTEQEAAQLGMKKFQLPEPSHYMVK